MAETPNKTEGIIRRKAMDVMAVRIPHEEMMAVRRLAKVNQCRVADVVRTAMHRLLDKEAR